MTAEAIKSTKEQHNVSAVTSPGSANAVHVAFFFLNESNNFKIK